MVQFLNIFTAFFLLFIIAFPLLILSWPIAAIGEFLLYLSDKARCLAVQVIGD